MKVITMEEVCQTISEAEDKLPSLRIRKINRLIKWLDSINFEYALAEGIDVLEIAELMHLLSWERFLREMQDKGYTK